MPSSAIGNGTYVATKPSGPLNLGNRIPCSIFQREQNVTYGAFLASTGAQLGAAVVDGATTRTRERTPTKWGVADLSLEYQNYWNTGNGETTLTAPITLAAVIEYPVNTFTPVRFNGASTATLAPNQTLVSDPVPIAIPANTYFWVRTFATVPAPAQVSPGIPAGNELMADIYGVDATICGSNHPSYAGNGSNQLTTSGTAWMTNTSGYGFGPICTIGTPTTRTYLPTVGVVGGSIARGYNQGGAQAGNNGYLGMALNAASLSFCDTACYGEAGATFATNSLRLNRMLRIAQCSSVIFAYGRNDIFNNGLSFSQLLTALLAAIGAAGSYGATVWVTTLLPDTNSSDAWATVANQSTTSASGNVVRLQWNAYLRASAAAGAGASAAYDLAAQGTLYGGCIDVASAIETTSAGTVPVFGTLIPNADRWYVVPGNPPTLDGTHPTLYTETTFLVPVVPVAAFV